MPEPTYKNPEENDMFVSGQHSSEVSPSKSQELAERARAVDSQRKALTGRTPERIEEETGIPTEYMFPKDAKILYIGDPWQRMGRELDESHGSKVTIVDYEYGEVASFVDDEDEFMENMTWRSNNLIAELESRLGEDAAEIYGEEDAKWLADFYELVTRAVAISTTAKSDEEYARASEAWSDAREHIEKNIKKKLKNNNLERNQEMLQQRNSTKIPI